MLTRIFLHREFCARSFSAARWVYVAMASLIGSMSVSRLPNIRLQQISCLGGVTRVADSWQIFRVNESQAKSSRIWEIVIPDFIEEHEIAGWLDDMYHESATENHPTVLRIK